MKYRVRLQPSAEKDLEEAYLWAAKHAPETATRWLHRFREVLQTLADNPQRCGAAPEDRKLKRDLRQLLYGKRSNVFRAVFVIDGELVRILRIRRAARRPLTREDLSEG